MDIAQIEGKVFRSVTGEEFGVIRRLDGAVPEEIAMHSCSAFAEDDCGNYFVEGKDFIAFWDHETNEVTKLTSLPNEFVDALVQPEDVQLPLHKIISTWIDPEFLKEINSK